MAQIDQPIGTYSDTTAQRKEITDAISFIDPVETPLIDWLGFNSANSKFKFVGDPNIKIEWLEDTYRALTSTMAASCTSTATSLTVTDGTDFKVGDVIQIDDEYCWTSAISTNTLTVERGWGGTTKATHASDDTITILYNARTEGADADQGPKTDVTQNSNYTMILEESVKVTGSQIAMAQYGIGDELSYQIRKLLPTLSRFLERACFYGKRTAGSTTTSPRSMGGFDVFITDNTSTTSAANMTLGNMEAVILSAHLDGGKPDTLVCSPLRLQTIKDLYDNSGYLTIQRDEDTVGMSIGKLQTPWGLMNFRSSRWCPNTRLYFLDSRYVGMYTYRPWSERELPSDGDYRLADLLGEFSLVVAQDKAHACLQLS